MPNCEPQSPRWLSRMTRWPRAAKIRARLSPITVERMCPTCIGLATLGEEKSMTTVRGFAGRREARGTSSPSRSPSVSRDPGVVEPDVEKPGPGDLGRAGQRLEVDRAGDAGGQVARVLAQRSWPGPCSRWPGNRRTWGRPSARTAAWKALGSPPSGVAAPKAARKRSRTFMMVLQTWSGSRSPAVAGELTIQAAGSTSGSAVGLEAIGGPGCLAATRGLRSPVELRGVAPDLLEGVIGPALRREDVDHEVAVVDQDPAAFLRALQPELVLAQLLHLGVDLAGDGVALPPGGGGGDHEEVEQRGRLAQVEEQDVLGPVVVGDPGGEPGVLERPVHPVGVAPVRPPARGRRPGRHVRNGRAGLSSGTESLC